MTCVLTVMIVVNGSTRSKPLLSLMNEVGLVQLSNRVVAVTDEELLLVVMQHVCQCRCY